MSKMDHHNAQSALDVATEQHASKEKLCGGSHPLSCFGETVEERVAYLAHVDSPVNKDSPASPALCAAKDHELQFISPKANQTQFCADEAQKKQKATTQGNAEEHIGQPGNLASPRPDLHFATPYSDPDSTGHSKTNAEADHQDGPASDAQLDVSGHHDTSAQWPEQNGTVHHSPTCSKNEQLVNSKHSNTLVRDNRQTTALRSATPGVQSSPPNALCPSHWKAPEPMDITEKTTWEVAQYWSKGILNTKMLSSRQISLARKPAQRWPDCHDFRIKPPGLTRSENIKSLLIHISGPEASTKCNQCLDGFGRWKHFCIVDSSESTGACASCIWSGRGSHCSHNRSNQPVFEVNSEEDRPEDASSTAFEAETTLELRRCLEPLLNSDDIILKAHALMLSHYLDNGTETFEILKIKVQKFLASQRLSWNAVCDA